MINDYVSSNQTQKNPDHFTPFSSEDEDVDYDYDYVSSNQTQKNPDHFTPFSSEDLMRDFAIVLINIGIVTVEWQIT